MQISVQVWRLVPAVTRYFLVAVGRLGLADIRNMRFTVAQLLELLAAGMTHEEILEDYLYWEQEDIYACLLFAARMANVKSIIPLVAA